MSNLSKTEAQLRADHLALRLAYAFDLRLLLAAGVIEVSSPAAPAAG